MKSGGFELTKVQIKILKVLTLNQEKGLGNNIGLTRSGMERFGIPDATFDKNRKVLIEKHLIRLVTIETKKMDRKFYDITVLGFLILYKILIEDEKNEIIPDSSIGRFFPLIYKHWSELEKAFVGDREGYSTKHFFDLTTRQISFQFVDQGSVFVVDPTDFQIVRTFRTLDMGFFDITIKGELVFGGSIEKNHFFIRKRGGIRPDFDYREQWMKKLAGDMTFLFFCNAFQREGSYEVKGGTISIPRFFGLYLKNDETGGKLQKNYRNLINKLTKIIKNDEELKEIFRQNISTIEKIQKKSELIRYLKELC